jgi:hypothetical protein
MRREVCGTREDEAEPSFVETSKYTHQNFLAFATYHCSLFLFSRLAKNESTIEAIKMQRMQRKIGAMLPRTADDSQVAMLIADFEAADKMLETVCYMKLHVYLRLISPIAH